MLDFRVGPLSFTGRRRAIVSIDAMGTQLKNAIGIIQAGARYLLAFNGD